MIHNTCIVHLDTAVRSNMSGNLIVSYYKIHFYKTNKNKRMQAHEKHQCFRRQCLPHTGLFLQPCLLQDRLSPAISFKDIIVALSMKCWQNTSLLQANASGYIVLHQSLLCSLSGDSDCQLNNAVKYFNVKRLIQCRLVKLL